MRILHINNFAYPDYLNDMVFHGGRSVFGQNYETSHRPDYMYRSYEPKKNTLYGKGFTLYAKLEDQDADAEISQKISDRYYDYIIYGSVYRCDSFWDLVVSAYQRDRILLIDGEDHTGIHPKASNGIYFKRELNHDDQCIRPINFAVPRTLFSMPSSKSRAFATVIPGETHTYKFEREDDYYQDYQSSYFGVTCRKAGWDCLRHYEIMACGCMPRFPDLISCPRRTMAAFPKQLVSDYYKKHGCKVTPEYWPTLHQIYEHAKNYCNTEYLIQYILGQADEPPAR